MPRASTIQSLSLFFISILCCVAADAALPLSCSGSRRHPPCLHHSLLPLWTNSTSNPTQKSTSEPKIILAALLKGLDRATSARAFVANILSNTALGAGESEGLHDCLTFMDLSAYRVMDTVRELNLYMLGDDKTRMKLLSEKDFDYHMSNMQSYAGGALDILELCLDGFVDLGLNGTLEAAMTREVAYVEQPMHDVPKDLAQYLSDYSASAKFISASCSGTCYPKLCRHSLLPYATNLVKSPDHVVEAALAVSLAGAKSTVKKLVETKNGNWTAREHGAIANCSRYMGNSVDHLNQAVRAFGRHFINENSSKSEEKGLLCSRIGDLWANIHAAAVNGKHCVGVLSREPFNKNTKLKSSILGRVAKGVKLTKNALSLVHEFLLLNNM